MLPLDEKWQRKLKQTAMFNTVRRVRRVWPLNCARGNRRQRVTFRPTSYITRTRHECRRHDADKLRLDGNFARALSSRIVRARPAVSDAH